MVAQKTNGWKMRVIAILVTIVLGTCAFVVTQIVGEAGKNTDRIQTVDRSRDQDYRTFSDLITALNKRDSELDKRDSDFAHRDSAFNLVTQMIIAKLEIMQADIEEIKERLR